MDGCLQWYRLHCGRGVLGICKLCTAYAHRRKLSTDVQDVGLTYTQLVSLIEDLNLWIDSTSSVDNFCQGVSMGKAEKRSKGLLGASVGLC